MCSLNQFHNTSQRSTPCLRCSPDRLLCANAISMHKQLGKRRVTQTWWGCLDSLWLVLCIHWFPLVSFPPALSVLHAFTLRVGFYFSFQQGTSDLFEFQPCHAALLWDALSEPFLGWAAAVVGTWGTWSMAAESKSVLLGPLNPSTSVSLYFK